MILRLNVIVEGRSEEAFVNQVLAPHLGAYGVMASVHCITTRRDRRRNLLFRGGMQSFGQIRRDLDRWLAQESGRDARFTTMIDLYALPSDFPGVDTARRLVHPVERVRALETALGESVGDSRFIPYLQLHEFEALLLAEPVAFLAQYPGREGAVAALEALVETYDSPELIDDGPTTAPSKRIGTFFPEYLSEKATAGPLIAARVGLAQMRDRCPHFAAWLTQLETLVERP